MEPKFISQEQARAALEQAVRDGRMTVEEAEQMLRPAREQSPDRARRRGWLRRFGRRFFIQW
ncbi:MAG: hypothetical protein M3281_07275 [Chloroflexota bacterium]|nr:hypothetical protein [Chloroflexota bacterium]